MYNKIIKNYQISIGNPFKLANETFSCSISSSQQKDNSDENMQEELFEVEEDPQCQAELIIQEAKMEAMEIISKAIEEANLKKQQIYEEARKAGYEEGTAISKKEYEALIEEAKEIKLQAQTEHEKMLKEFEQEAVSLVLDIAKKVISDEVVLNKQNVLLLFRQAIEKCVNRENMVLRVSDEDYDYSIKNKERILSMVEGVSNLEICRDSSLEPGSCIIETEFGTIDASVQTKLSQIEEAFLKERAG